MISKFQLKGVIKNCITYIDEYRVCWKDLELFTSDDKDKMYFLKDA